MSSSAAEGSCHVWYFGIGSMCHPMAVRVREIEPEVSVAAVLYGYERLFLEPRGMASLVVKKDSTVCGVAHLVTEKDIERLSDIEVGYEKVHGKCKCIKSGGVVDCVFFVTGGDSFENGRVKNWEANGEVLRFDY